MNSSWEAVRLGDIAVINPENTSAFTANRKIRYVDISSVSAESGIASDSLMELAYGEAPGRARRVVRPGDVLVSTVRPNLRAFAQVPGELDGQVASTGFTVLRSVQGRALPDYIWALIRTEQFVVSMVEQATGSNYPAIRPQNVSDYTVLLPPLDEQRRIVDLIGALDEAIDAADQGTNDLAALLLSLQSDVPNGPMVPLGTVLTDIDSGVSSKPSEDANGTLNIGILKVSAVRSALFQAHEIKRLGNLQMPEKARVREGDLLITRSNTPATVGQVCIARDVPADSFLPDLIWRLNIDRTVVVPEFLEHYLSNSESRSAITSMATGTSLSMRKINKTNIKTLQISLPSLGAQVDYAERCDASRIGLACSRENAESLRSLRTELLTSLLSGAHTIPESYDELLEAVNA